MFLKKVVSHSLRGHLGPTLSLIRIKLPTVRHYHQVPESFTDKDFTEIDLRSDTVTRPSPQMREAMLRAPVGDDVFGEDETVNKLQEICAEMFGKEAALFVPTGTMGNLISILSHCPKKGQEAILGHRSHIFLYEQGGISSLAGVLPSFVDNKPDGTLDLEQLRSRLRPTHSDPHQPHSRLICLENTHNACGGKVLPMDFLQEVYDIAQSNGIPVHIDGARIMHAAHHLGIKVKDIMEYADTVSMCFSKGLGAPVGSVIAGSQSFINTAVRMRKVLGGGWRQAGMLAAAAMYSLEHIAPELAKDHIHAQMLAEGIMSADQNLLKVDITGVHSNIVIADVESDEIKPQDIVDRLRETRPAETVYLGEAISIRCLAWLESQIRFVTHNDISTPEMEKAINKLKFVLQEMCDTEDS